MAYERVELKDGQCPDCGGGEYWEGPSGGASINICCRGCLSAFNIGPGNFAERIPNTHFVQNGAKAQPRPEPPAPKVRVEDLPPFMQHQEMAMRRVGLSMLTESGRWPVQPKPGFWNRVRSWFGL